MRMFYHRATQTYLWALPLITRSACQCGSEKGLPEKDTTFLLLEEAPRRKTLVTTPNSDVIYAMSYCRPRQDGPLGVWKPADAPGDPVDFWQRPIPVDGGEFRG